MKYINLPKNVQKILDIIREEDSRAYIVGGCVRDSIMDREIHDWDICTDALPEKIMDIFNSRNIKTIPTGIKYGTITVILDGESYEITTFRSDIKYEDNRHPEVEFTLSLMQDLCRRDFTINAIAYDDKQDILIDPFNGIRDIQKGVIRCVGKPEERFEEDLIRILRAIRFSCQLSYRMEGSEFNIPFKIAIPELKSMDKLYHKLNTISVERVRAELEKILLSGMTIGNDPLDKVLEVIIPELSELKKVKQNNPYHRYNAYEHTMKTIRYTESDSDVSLKLAALFHDIGKAQTETTDENGVDHYYNHHKVSSDMAIDIMKRLKYDNDTITKVSKLILYHDREVKPTEIAVKRFMNQIGSDLILDWCRLRLGDIISQSTDYITVRNRELIQIEELAKEIINKKEPITRKDIAIDGKDLMSLGFKQGKIIGYILDKLLDIVIEDPSKNTYETLIEIAKTI